MGNEIMSLKNIEKRYPGVIALHRANITFRSGEVHTLLGENGAGKSTLIKVMTGAIEPEEGEILFEGTAYRKLSPALAKQLGVGAVYQDQFYAPELSVAENMFLGNYPHKGAFVDRKKMMKMAREALEILDIQVDPGKLMKEVSFSYRQLIEIAKAAAANVKVLILDESTAALTNNEIDVLFRIVRQLRSRGVAIVFISHRIEEVFEISDQITVMRDGEVIRTFAKDQVSRKELLSLMVGREFTETYPGKDYETGKTILEVKNLTGERFHNISFHVKGGEILGFAGLVGAGRTEIMRALFGADPIESGEIFLNGDKLPDKLSPNLAISLGIGLVPEDRKEEGILNSLNVRQNISFSVLQKISKNGFVNSAKDQAFAEEFRGKLRIKTPTVEQMAITLSGGNQQKVVLSRWLLTDVKVLILDEPTRGIDVGAKQEIYQIMWDIARQGIAIIMVSSEMAELIGMSDRIIVVSEGRITGELSPEDFNQRSILELAAK